MKIEAFLVEINHLKENKMPVKEKGYCSKGGYHKNVANSC